MMVNQHPKDNPFRVTLFGATSDVPNLGCRALTASLVRLINEVRPDAEVSLLFGNRTGGAREIRISDEEKVEVEIVNARLSPKARFGEHFFTILLAALLYRVVHLSWFRRWLCNRIPWLDALDKADFVGDVFAGDSFSDIYGVKRLVMNAWGSVTALVMRKKLVLLPQTYGPYNSRVARAFARFILSRASGIYARDKVGKEIVRETLGKRGMGKEVHFCPDVAFALPAIAPEEAQIEPPLSVGKQTPLVGINISGLLYVGGYTGKNMFGLKCEYKELICSLAERFLRDTEAEVLLVPHEGFSFSDEGDRNACESVFSALSPEFGSRIHILRSVHDQHEAKHIIGQCDFFIGSRLHATIAGLSQAVPTVGIAYSRKFQGVFDTVGVGEMVLDAREVSLEELLDSCIRLFEDRSRIRAHLEEVLPGVRAQVRTCFAQMLGETVPLSADEADVPPPLRGRLGGDGALERDESAASEKRI